MLKNYYILNRLVCEIREKLKDQQIIESYTQEKNRIYFHIPDQQYPNRHLIISTDQTMPYILTKKEHHKAKKNVPEFFKKYLPALIKDVEISENDRIIRFKLDIGYIYFFIRGPRTNIMMVANDGTIETFKKLSEDDIVTIQEELDSTEWISTFNIPDLSELENDQYNYSAIRKLYPTLGSEIKRELAARGLEESKSGLTNLLTEIATVEIAVGFSPDLAKVILVPETSPLLDNMENVEKFISVEEAINYFISKNFRTINEFSTRNDIEKYLSKELSGLSTKLNKLRSRVEQGSRDKEYNHYGSLLLANIDKIERGKSEIIVDDYTTGDKIKISLNPKLSPNKNVDYYFQKSKDEKISYEKSLELFEDTKEKYEHFLEISKELEKTTELTDLKNIAASMNLDKKKHKGKKLEEIIKYRHYVIDAKYHVFVGRDNKNNDLVTFKLAKQNDFWFHARGVPGSHVVLRVDNPKEPVPKNILKNVASIAANYSKAKTAGTVPVSYTFRKYVRKGKGMAPGKVIIERETVLLVKPEIPKNSEQIDESFSD